MNQIEAQRRMRMASQEKAEGDKILAVTAARAEAEAKELSGQGVARQRKAIVDGLKESVLQFNEGVMGTSPADVMQLMMVTQYLDMLKDVGTKDGAKTIFIPHSPAAVRCPRSARRLPPALHHSHAEPRRRTGRGHPEPDAPRFPGGQHRADEPGEPGPRALSLASCTAVLCVETI